MKCWEGGAEEGLTQRARRAQSVGEERGWQGKLAEGLIA
jgi:hypothetical protein